MARQPNFKIGVTNKATGAKNNNIGAGWENSDGSISLVINFGCAPIGYDPDLVITLFSADKPRENKK
jgi:hypothetical protein